MLPPFIQKVSLPSSQHLSRNFYQEIGATFNGKANPWLSTYRQPILQGHFSSLQLNLSHQPRSLFEVPTTTFLITGQLLLLQCILPEIKIYVK